MLVEADRVSWNQERVALLQRRHANPDEQTREDRSIRVGKDTSQLQRSRRWRNVNGSKVQASFVGISVLVGQSEIDRYAALFYCLSRPWVFWRSMTRSRSRSLIVKYT